MSRPRRKRPGWEAGPQALKRCELGELFPGRLYGDASGIIQRRTESNPLLPDGNSLGRGIRPAAISRRRDRARRGMTQQGRQDSNLQPPVLETGALPIELRPWVGVDCIGASRAVPKLGTRRPSITLRACSGTRSGFSSAPSQRSLPGRPSRPSSAPVTRRKDGSSPPLRSCSRPGSARSRWRLFEAGSDVC